MQLATGLINQNILASVSMVLGDMPFFKNLLVHTKSDSKNSAAKPDEHKIHEKLNELYDQFKEEFIKELRKFTDVRGLGYSEKVGAEGLGSSGNFVHPLLVLTDPDAQCIRQISRGIYVKLSNVEGTQPHDCGGVRINEIVSSLMYYGICNTTDARDPDQRYMTLKDYRPIFEKRGQDPSSKEYGLLVRSITNRLMDAFADWFVKTYEPSTVVGYEPRYSSARLDARFVAH